MVSTQQGKALLITLEDELGFQIMQHCGSDCLTAISKILILFCSTKKTSICLVPATKLYCITEQVLEQEFGILTRADTFERDGLNLCSQEVPERRTV